ncbi:MAG TPA: DUF3040 domain-containing protein [Micromonosporaceae bacterium]|nr:DUF3040 domain-containing protein [Micromonosporaceae bacterium]
MPLSEHEQRLFDQIEQSLAKDPKFASAVRASDPRFHAKRRIILAAFVAVVGLAVVVLGVASKNPLVGVAGFVVMLGSAVFGYQAARHGQGAQMRVVGGTAARTTRVRRSSILDKLEDRWRGRDNFN